MHRREIKKAPYNPRRISDEAKAKLKRNIKKVGLLDTFVFNKTTGNLVSGHQRLSILDSLEKSEDYYIDVAIVELDEKTEKEQNLFMNNANAMGEFDPGMVRALMDDIDFSFAGFDASDLHIFGVDVSVDDQSKEINSFGDSPVEEAEYNEALEEDIQDEEGHKFNDEVYETAREKRKAIIDSSTEKNTGENYVILTFKDDDSKAAFNSRFGFSAHTKNIDGNIFSNMIERII